MDARVYLAALALTLVSALLFGMIPARQVWQSSPLQAMKSGPVDSMPLRRFALRDLLLGAQIAICTLLVTASLVAVRGMVRMLHAPLGFQPQGAMLADMDLSQVDRRRRGAREKESDDRGGAEHPRCDGGGCGEPHALYRRDAWDSGFPAGDDRVHAEQFCAGAVRVSQCRRDTWRLPALGCWSGRDVSWHDTTKTPYVAIVNETFARKMWGETPAIGQRFILMGHLTRSGGRGGGRQVPRPAGVAAAVVYLPLSQSEQSEAIFVVRSRRAPNEMAAALERTLSGIEPNVPITVQSWPDTLDGCAVPGTGGDSGTGRHGPAGGDAGGDGHLRYGGLQREPADEGAGHPRGIGRAHETRDERGGRAANRAAWRGIVGWVCC